MVGSRGFSTQEKCEWPLLVSLLLVLKRIIEQENSLEHGAETELAVAIKLFGSTIP